MEERDRLDRFLDRTMAEHSAAEPRAGFEQRILANLAAQRDENAWAWKWLWVAGPILSAAVVLVVVFAMRPVPKRDSDVAVVRPPAEATTNAPLPKGEIGQAPIARIRPKGRVHTKVVAKMQPTQPMPEPRLGTFPAQDSDEQQARLLLSFVTRHPDKAKEVVNEEEEFQQMAEANLNKDSDNAWERQR